MNKIIYLNSTKLITFDGKIKDCEECNPGDSLITNESKIVVIKEIKKVYKDCVRVLPCKGKSFISNKDNRIYIKDYKNKKRVEYNIEIEKCLQLQKTVNNFQNRIRLTRCKQLDFTENKLFVHPYIYGLYLASNNGLQFKNIGENVINKINKLGKQDDKIMFSYVSGIFSSKNNYIYNYLVENDTYVDSVKNKDNLFVRQEYLYTSIEDRKELLSGIIDGRMGHLKEENFTYDLSLKNEILIDQIGFLAKSCGFLVTKKYTKKYSLIVKEGKKRKLNPIPRIYVSGNFERLPIVGFNLQDKKRLSTRDWKICNFVFEELNNEEVYEFHLTTDDKDSEISLINEDFFVIS